MISWLIYEAIEGPALLGISLSFHFIMQNNSGDIENIYQNVHRQLYTTLQNCAEAMRTVWQCNVAHQVIQWWRYDGSSLGTPWWTPGRWRWESWHFSCAASVGRHAWAWLWWSLYTWSSGSLLQWHTQSSARLVTSRILPILGLNIF